MGKFEFENQGTNTYLVYTLEEEEEIDTMSLGMITNNHIKGIADTVYHQMDETRQIKYNVTAKVSLKQFFAGAVNKKRLLSVFSAIIDAMSEIEDYMLDSKSILLDKEHIFINVATYEIGLICIPVVRENEEGSDVGKFFKETVFTTQFDPTENTSYVAEFLSFFNSNPVFSIDAFKKELEKLDGFVGVNTPPVQPQVPPVSPVNVSPVMPTAQPAPAPNPVPSGGMNFSGGGVNPVKPVSLGKEPIHVTIQENVQPPKNLPNGNQTSGMNIPGKVERPSNLNIPGKGTMPSTMDIPGKENVVIPGKGPAPVKEESSENKSNEKPMSTWYLLQHYSKKNAAIYKEQKAARKAEKEASKKKGKNEKEEESFVVPGAPVNQGNSQQIQNNNQQQAQAMQQAQQMQQMQEAQRRQQLEAQRLQQLQLQQAQEAQRRQQQAQEAQRLQQMQLQQAQEAQRLQQLQMQQAQEAQRLQQMQMQQAQQMQQIQQAQLTQQPVGNYGDTTVLTQNGAGETTVLNQNEVQQMQQPYLIRRRNNERIPINKPAFRIGKEKSYVDYFIGDNSAISRSHANIINRDGKYFIVDTNSTNHTYINGVMIQSNVEMELAHGMNLRLANEEFEFRML